MSDQWLLRDLRCELGLTQQAVARAAGLTQIRISILERGVEQPTSQERASILQALVSRAAVRGLEILILERN